ncbi:MAG: flagellar export protein FliJ [Treponema sp.]|nr:flagellar export protein FliJ [Treponema sp.]
MKRFSFGLEKVLKLRQYREQEAKNDLGQAIGILTAIENNIKQNALVRGRAVQERFMGLDVGGQAGAFSMMAWDNYILRLEQEAQRLMEDAARAELVVEEKRKLYLEASRELKVMEKLKEKREGEYRKEVFAAETRELDDMWRPW